MPKKRTEAEPSRCEYCGISTTGMCYIGVEAENKTTEPHYKYRTAKSSEYYISRLKKIYEVCERKDFAKPRINGLIERHNKDFPSSPVDPIQ